MNIYVYKYKIQGFQNTAKCARGQYLLPLKEAIKAHFPKATIYVASCQKWFLGRKEGFLFCSHQENSSWVSCVCKSIHSLMCDFFEISL